MIYFDNSATTMPYPEALRTYQEVSTKIFGNPSSLHQLGTSATRLLVSKLRTSLENQPMRFSLRLVEPKETIGLSRVWPSKKSLMANISSFPILNTLR